MSSRRRRRSAWSIPIGRLAGIPISLHVSFFLLLALVVAFPGPAGAWAGLVWVAIVFGCVVVHELAHSVVARRRGGTVRSILLLPVGGVSQIEHVPEGWANEFVVAAVGPLASLGIAGVAAVVGLLAGTPLWPPELFAGSWLARTLWVNVLLAGFNLLPAFPMDGGRVLRALLERRHGLASATRTAAAIGRVAGMLMIVAGVLWDLWLAFIGLLVVVAAAGEEAATETHLRLRGVPAGRLMRPTIDIVDARLPLPLHVTREGPWVVTVGGSYLGTARGHDLARTSSGTVADVTDAGAGALGMAEDMGDSGLDKLLAADGHLLPVVDHGMVLGVVRLTDVNQWLAGDGSGTGGGRGGTQAAR